tara:strand:- start:173 stop:391 length:219 start_codon:yes stop_codon:yes gene_type:complete
MSLKEFIMSEKKGLKTYILTICYNDKTDELEYIQEQLDVETKSIIVGTVDITEYFDEECMALIDEMYDVGTS